MCFGRFPDRSRPAGGLARVILAVEIVSDQHKTKFPQDNFRSRILCLCIMQANIFRADLDQCLNGAGLVDDIRTDLGVRQQRGIVVLDTVHHTDQMPGVVHVLQHHGVLLCIKPLKDACHLPMSLCVRFSLPRSIHEKVGTRICRIQVANYSCCRITGSFALLAIKSMSFLCSSKLDTLHRSWQCGLGSGIRHKRHGGLGNQRSTVHAVPHFELVDISVYLHIQTQKFSDKE